MTGYKIIDVDTHVTEPADLWTSRVPASMKDRVPHVITDKKGQMWWVLGGKRISSPGMGAVAGVGDMMEWPATYDQMLPSAYDAVERLKYMDSVRTWAMVMYPNVGGFGAQEFLKLGDPQLMLACVKAYNDWQVEWASADSRRLLPTTSIPFWDIKETIAEIRRCERLGHRAILFTGEPQTFGQPIIGDPHWNPLWEVATELNMSLSFHIGSGNMETGLRADKVKTYGRMAAFAETTINFFLRNGSQLCDLLMSGVLVRFPTLKFVSVESGVGWIPFVLEALDYQFIENRVREERPDMKLLPSEYFAQSVYACYWFEKIAGRRLVETIGADRIMVETDFPHPTSLYGDEVSVSIENGLSTYAPDVRRKIMFGNAQRVYNVASPTQQDELKFSSLQMA